MYESHYIDSCDDLPNSFSENSNKSVPSEMLAESISEKPRMTIQSITKQQFPIFSHFFVCVTRAFNLVGCSMKSLQLKIRIVPSIPVIETPTVWCIDSEVNFRSGYALDFSKFVSSFNLGDYTPVVEFYRKLPDKIELFGFALLPLKVVEKTECAGQPLTYLLKNQSVDIRQFTTGQIIGYVTVTIALGYPQQQQFIDPDTMLPSSSANNNNPQIEGNLQIVNNQVTEGQGSGEEEDEEDEDDENYHRSRHHRHHRRKRKRNEWIQKAMAFGWKPPGYVDPEWKDKAAEKGWTPPNAIILSSIGVTCKPKDCPNLKDVETQQIEALIPPQPEISTDSSEDSQLQLIKLLNPKFKNKQNENSGSCSYSMQSPECVFSSFPELKATRVITLFEKDQNLQFIEDTVLSSLNSSTDDIDQSINNILDVKKPMPIMSLHDINLTNLESSSNSQLDSETSNENCDQNEKLPLNQNKISIPPAVSIPKTNVQTLSTKNPEKQVLQRTDKSFLDKINFDTSKTHFLSESYDDDNDDDDDDDDILEGDPLKGLPEDILKLFQDSKNKNDKEIDTDVDQEIQKEISSSKISKTFSALCAESSTDSDIDTTQESDSSMSSASSSVADLLARGERCDSDFMKLFNIMNS